MDGRGASIGDLLCALTGMEASRQIMAQSIATPPTVQHLIFQREDGELYRRMLDRAERPEVMRLRLVGAIESV
jgi:hypothetical protein